MFRILRCPISAVIPCLILLCAVRMRLEKPLAADHFRPNIILVLADDLGWSDLGCYGSGFYETPHIDRLARQGMRFTQAYASASQCAPTRASLMTGRDIPRHGIWAVSRLRGLEKNRRMVPPPNVTRLPLGEMTVAELLQEAGYRTAMFGKWHLGTDEEEYLPVHRGFDEAMTFPDAYRYFNFRTRPRVEIDPSTYLTDFLTRQAISFIDANTDNPFFLYLPHFAVHGPLKAKEGLVERYRDRKPVEGQGNPVYAAMIESLDEGVGHIMKRLEELNLEKNTLLIFYSDNGGAGGYESEGIEWFSPTSNRPLRGGKGMLYEGGTRVPLIARWSGVIEAGTVCNEPVTSTDFFPTFLELAAWKGRLKNPVDGLSLLPLLKQEDPSSFQHRALYWHYPSYLQASTEKGTWRITPSGAIRLGDFKLLEFFEDGRLELYNLRTDIGESHNLARTDPQRTNELHEKLMAWRRATGALMPTSKAD